MSVTRASVTDKLISARDGPQKLLRPFTPELNYKKTWKNWQLLSVSEKTDNSNNQINI
jgi:hypothetical protein